MLLEAQNQTWVRNFLLKNTKILKYQDREGNINYLILSKKQLKFYISNDLLDIDYYVYHMVERLNLVVTTSISRKILSPEIIGYWDFKTWVTNFKKISTLQAQNKCKFNNSIQWLKIHCFTNKNIIGQHLTMIFPDGIIWKHNLHSLNKWPKWLLSPNNMLNH